MSPLSFFLQAVRLESAYPQVTRYMVVVSNNGRQDTEESIVLGMDFVSSDRSVPLCLAAILLQSIILTCGFRIGHVLPLTIVKKDCSPLKLYLYILMRKKSHVLDFKG